MENSIPSPMDNSLCSDKKQTAASEISGWSLYIDDFLASEKKEATSNGWSSSSTTGGDDRPFMASDAASLIELKLPGAMKPSKVCKKRKGRSSFDDDSLEDTASSPAKVTVSEFYQLDVNSKKKKNRRDDSQEEHILSVNCGDHAIHEMHGVSGNEKRYECNELRKRGLCLVPVSMLLNFLG